MSTGTFDSIDIAEFVSPDGLREVTVFSRSLNRRADITVYVPPGLDARARLPLIILLHGVYGSHWSWSRSGHAHLVLQKMIDGGEIAPVMLAMPSDGLFGIGSGYVARPGMEDAERWIIDEVPEVAALVHPHVRGAGIGLAGLSMGGWAALRLAARHGTRVRCAFGLSPLTAIADVAGYAEEWHRVAHAPPVDDPELLPLLVRERDTMPPIAISCGRDDALIADVRRLRDGLHAAGMRPDYTESPGGHTWGLWRRELPVVLRFLDAHLRVGGTH